MRSISGIPSLIAKQIARDQMHLIEHDAAEVRRFITNNLLLGRMLLDAAPNQKGFDSICAAMRTCYLIADARGDKNLMRVIEGCERPMVAILERCEALGEVKPLQLELATIVAASNRALDALDDFGDTDLVIAHSQWHADQMQARAAVAPKNRAARRAAAKKAKR